MRRRRWAADFERMFGLVNGRLSECLTRLFHDLPEGCFSPWDTQSGEALGVPLSGAVRLNGAPPRRRFAISTPRPDAGEAPVRPSLRRRAAQPLVSITAPAGAGRPRLRRCRNGRTPLGRSRSNAVATGRATLWTRPASRSPRSATPPPVSPVSPTGSPPVRALQIGRWVRPFATADMPTP